MPEFLTPARIEIAIEANNDAGMCVLAAMGALDRGDDPAVLKALLQRVFTLSGVTHDALSNPDDTGKSLRNKLEGWVA
jgi:hypothetical protein